MDTPVFIAAVAGPIFLVMGLSVLFYPASWENLMKSFANDHFSLFSLMILHMLLGLMVIRVHNVWEMTPWVIVTVIGWGAFLKGALYMLLPGEWTKGMINMCNNRVCMTLGGLVALVVGGVLGYYAYLV